MKRVHRLYRSGYVYLACIVLLISTPLSAADEIVFATTTALTGPSKFLGLSMVRGIEAHFDEVNRLGGVNDRPIRFIKRDDGYDPMSAAQNAEELLANSELLALVGNVGTPTAEAVLPLLKEQQMMLFGAFSGATLLRDDVAGEYAKNFRASYLQETALIIETILNRGISANEIALLTQNDSYGKSGYLGVEAALKTHNFDAMESLPHGSYERSTLNVEDGLLDILGSEKPIRAIIIIGTYRPAAKFVRMAHEVFPQAEFYTVSFMGASAFAPELMRQLAEIEQSSSFARAVKTNTQGSDCASGCQSNKPYSKPVVFMSQVVPPLDSPLPAVSAYRQAMARFAADKPLDEVSLEGYLVARLLLEIVKRAEQPLNAKSLSSVLDKREEFDIGLEKPVEFGGKRKQASDRVWMSRFDGSRFVSLP